MELETAKKNLVKISRHLYQQGLVPGKSGNISCKIGGKGDFTVLITPSGVSLKDMYEKSVIIVDKTGKQLAGRGKPSSELKMHLNIYKKRDDVKGVVHTHSTYATGFSFSTEKISRMEGFGPIEKTYISVVEYAAPGSDKLAEIASEGLENDDVLILKDHGVLVVGKNLDEAALLAEFTESTAKTEFVARIISREPIQVHLKRSR
jgi:L-fuculose-phosphate aldolase